MSCTELCISVSSEIQGKRGDTPAPRHLLSLAFCRSSQSHRTERGTQKLLIRLYLLQFHQQELHLDAPTWCLIVGQQLPRCPTFDKQHFTDVTGHRCRKTFLRVTEGISKAERLSAKLCVRGLDGPSVVPADDLMLYLHCWGLRTSARTYRLDFLMVSVVIPPFLSLWGWPEPLGLMSVFPEYLEIMFALPVPREGLLGLESRAWRED